MNPSEPAARPRAGLRILSALVALPLAAYGLVLAFEQLRTGVDLLETVFASYATTLAALTGAFAWRGDDPANRVRLGRAWIGGLLLGFVGFAAGFFGPIMLAPEANQGPLLGIFFTGPLGFVLGVMAGWLSAPRVDRHAGEGR